MRSIATIGARACARFQSEIFRNEGLTLGFFLRMGLSSAFRLRSTTARPRGPVGGQRRLLPVVLAAIVAFTSCHRSPRLPNKNSKTYADMVSAFYIGLAALQVGDDVHAESNLSTATQLVPGEPAAWANWGVLALRQRNYDVAAQRLEKARGLAPKNDRIYDLLGILESQRGNSAESIVDLRKAADLNPQNLRATYRLAEETERLGADTGAAEVQQLLQRILSAQPDNLAALLELSRIAAKRGDDTTLKSAVADISARSAGWRVGRGAAGRACVEPGEGARDPGGSPCGQPGAGARVDACARGGAARALPRVGVSQAHADAGSERGPGRGGSRLFRV